MFSQGFWKSLLPLKGNAVKHFIQKWHKLDLQANVRLHNPDRGFTIKPGVAVNTANPRENKAGSHEPQRRSTKVLVIDRLRVEPFQGSELAHFDPGVHCCASTPGFVVKPVPGSIALCFREKTLHSVAGRD